MNSTSDLSFHPDYAIAPGETLRERLTEIHVSQADLAARSGLSTKHVNQILQGVAPITHETALILERVTGTPAGIWNTLEATYRESLLRAKQRVLTPADRKWLSTLPIKALQQRGNIPNESDRGRLFEAALAFFGVGDRLGWERIWLRPVASFKRSKAFASDPAAVASWIRIGQLEARAIETQPYNPALFRKVLQQVRQLTREEDFSDALVAMCASAGVAVVFVAELDKTRVSGATWWSSPTCAVIALSDRYKHDDNFWFAFFHEAGHVLLHSKKETFIDDGSEDDELEDQAHAFAANTLIPSTYSDRLAVVTTDAEVEQLAEELGIAAGIVVGRLHHDHLWDWRKGNGLRRRLHIVDD